MELLRIYLQLFQQYSSHILRKKRPSTCTCSVIVQTSSTIWQFFLTEWPEDHKNGCLSSSTNSIGLHFHEGVGKIKENDKNTKIENLQNGQGKYGGKNPAYVYSWAKIKNNYNFFKFWFEIALNGYLDTFLT